MDRVSIIIPAFNKADLTVKAIESVLAQTYKNIECIVIDDGSTDATNILMQPFIRKKQIIYEWQENSGASSARNRGIRLSSGKYIGLLDCDDSYIYNKIELSIKYLKENNLKFVHTAAYVAGLINCDGMHSMSKLRIPGYLTTLPKIGNLLFRNYILNSTPIIHRECIARVGLFDTKLFIAADWDMWLRIEEHYKLGYLPRKLSMIGDKYSYEPISES